MASEFDNYELTEDENYKQDINKEMMEIVKRNKNIEDDRFTTEFSNNASKNQKNFEDIDEYLNEEEFLEDLDKSSLHIKEVCRDRCKDYVERTGGNGPGEFNIINEVFQKLKRQIDPQLKNTKKKSDKHKYTQKLRNRQIDLKISDSDEMLKKSDSLLDDMMENYSADENATDSEMENLTEWSNANRNLYDNLFGDTINKPSKYKNQKSFDEMRRIVDDKLARWAEYEKKLANEREEKSKFESIFSKGQKFFNTQHKFSTGKAQVQKMLKTQPSSSVKDLEYPDKINVSSTAATSLLNQWNLDELTDLANKYQQELNREKVKKTTKKSSKIWR